MKLITRFKNLFAKDGEVFDGYHTFNELYDYRRVYNMLFFNSLKGKCKVYKSHKHSDGELCFGGGWFIVVAELPTGQVTNHYENKYWNDFDIPEFEQAEYYDDHTPQEAYTRLSTIGCEPLELHEDKFSVLEECVRLLYGIGYIDGDLQPIIGGSLGMYLLGYEDSFNDVDIIIPQGTFQKYNAQIKSIFNKNLFEDRYESSSDSDSFDALFFTYTNGVKVDIIESKYPYNVDDLPKFRGMPIASPEQTDRARKLIIAEKTFGFPNEKTKWDGKVEAYEKKREIEKQTIEKYTKE